VFVCVCVYVALLVHLAPRVSASIAAGEVCVFVTLYVCVCGTPSASSLTCMDNHCASEVYVTCTCVLTCVRGAGCVYEPVCLCVCVLDVMSDMIRVGQNRV
jgi:hypothetical protein